MDSSELKKLIDRYLKNKATGQEQKLVDEWYQSYDDIDESLPAAKEQQLKNEIYNYASARINTPSTKIRRLNIFRYAAAAAIIVLATAALFLHREIAQQQEQQKTTYTIFKTGVGQVKKLDLPDG
ncbi:hypothetical protein ACFJIV_30890 [Mucilaginibacter sp. UC70_90]